MRHFEPEIETVTLMPSQGGRFEVTVNGSLLYSKLARLQEVQTQLARHIAIRESRSAGSEALPARALNE